MPNLSSHNKLTGKVTKFNLIFAITLTGDSIFFIHEELHVYLDTIHRKSNLRISFPE